MTRRLVYGIVPDRPRRAIHVVRILDAILEFPEIDNIAEKMRARLLSKFGEQSPNVVVVQGAGKETLRLFGDAHAVNRVRAAMFNATLNWSPLDLD
jgi:hypothetical protein